MAFFFKILLFTALYGGIFFQTLYIGVLLLGPVYRAPAFLIQAIDETLGQKGLRFEATDVWIHAHGQIKAKNLLIFLKSSSKPIAGAQRLQMTPAKLALLGGKWRPKAIQIENGFFAPQFHTKPLFHRLHLKAKGYAWGWDIGSFRTESFNTTLFAQGQILTPNLSLGQEADKASWMALLTTATQWLQAIDTSSLKLKFQRTNTRQTLCNAIFIADELHYQTQGATAQGLYAHGQFTFGSAGIQAPHPVSAHIKNLTHSALGKAKSVSLRFHFPSLLHNLQPPFVQRFDAFAPHLDCPWPIDRCSIYFEDLPLKPHVLTATAFQKNSWLRIKKDWEGPMPSIQAFENGPYTCSAKAHPETLKTLQEYFPMLKEIQHLPTVNLIGKAEFNGDWDTTEGKVFFNSKDLKWKNLEIEQLNGIWDKKDSIWIFKNLYASNPTGDIKGGVSIEFAPFKNLDNRYTMDLKGSINPRLLNPHLPKWWSKIWPGLSFPQKFPSTSLRIVLNDLDGQDFSVDGTVQAENLTYQTITYDHFETRLKALPGIVKLSTFTTEISPYKGQGSFSWQWDPITGDLQKNTFALKGNLPLQAYQALNPIKPWLGHQPASGHPYITIEGEVLPKDNFPQALNMTFDSQEPIALNGLQFDHLHFHIADVGQKFLITPIKAGFAKGKLSATAEITPAPSVPLNLNFQLNAEGMQWEALQNQFPILNKVGAYPILSRNTPEAHTQGPFGIIEGSFKGNMPMGQWERLKATGWVRLKASDYPNIFLNLNFLSSGFKNGFNLSKSPQGIIIQELSSTFTLNNGLLSLQDSWISGPSSRIIAKGTCFLPTKQLNLNFTIQPFREIPILSAAFLPLRPLTNYLQMNVTGTLDNPQIGK
jgi:hypothetical protein